jgi:hypothetical protein
VLVAVVLAADAEPSELPVQPGEGALDDPALAPKAPSRTRYRAVR